jgi:hypothetical protein
MFLIFAYRGHLQVLKVREDIADKTEFVTVKKI